MYSVVSVVRSEILQHGQCGVCGQMNRDTTAWSVSCLWSDDQGVQVPNFGTFSVSCRQLDADDNGSVLLQPSTCIYIYKRGVGGDGCNGQRSASRRDWPDHGLPLTRYSV